jgi:hypothetical protein
VRDEGLVPEPRLDVVVTLQDGTILDGWLVRYESFIQCEHVVFEPYEVDGICEVMLRTSGPTNATPSKLS